MTNLKNIVGKRLLKEIAECRQRRNDYMVMVCDDLSLRIVSACLRVHDINDAGVGAVVNVNVSREPLPSTAVVYFVRPLLESWRAMLADFDGGKKPIYGSAFLFTTSRVDDNLMRMLEKSKMVSRLKAFKELNIDFLSIESNVFTMGRDANLATLYFPSTPVQTRAKELARTAEQLTSLCVTLGEYPYIRYVASSPVTQEFAKLFDRCMEAVLRTLPNWNFNQQRGTVFIVDRSIDCVAPIMHEYTYQAMINDLLEVNGEICRLKDSGSKAKDSDQNSFVLSESDPVWLQLRHKHIAEAQPRVNDMFMEFRSQNAMAQLGDDASLKDMAKAAKQMTSYRTEMQKFTKHMTILEQAFDMFSDLKLGNLGELEQDMATGVDENGKKTSKHDVMSRLIAYIQDDKIGIHEKLRLIMIYIISQDGIKEATRKKLFTVARFDDEQQDSVQNLFHLGVTLQTSSKRNKGLRRTNTNLKKASKRAKEVPLQLMRFVPLLGEWMEELADGSLDARSFPFLKEPPERQQQQNQQQQQRGAASSSARSARDSSARSARPARANKWRRGGAAAFKQDDDDDAKDESGGVGKREQSNGPRSIVFMLGGATFSEMRCMYEVANRKKVDLLLGCTTTLTARQYVRELSSANHLDDIELDVDDQ